MKENYISSRLLQAREEKGLSLDDISKITNIRKSYLIALEEDNFNDLPEAVYTRNFIKLYARAVGIDYQDLIKHYEDEYQTEPIEKATNVPEYRDFSSPKKSLRFSPWLILLFLLAVFIIAALGLWFFNRDFVLKTFPQLDSIVSTDANAASNSTDLANTNSLENNDTSNLESSNSSDNLESDITPDSSEELSAGTNLAADTVSEDTSPILNVSSDEALPETTDSQNVLVAEIPATILLSIESEPSGATVSIDNFVLAEETPVVAAPVSSGEKRSIMISLAGHISYEEELDLYQDTSLDVLLEPVQTQEVGENSDPLSTEASTGIKIEISEDTWLEVYQSLNRGEGEVLVYKVIKAGQEFNFDLPVYIRAGRAGSVRIYINGKDLGKMGSSGEVLGKAYPVE